MFVNLSFNMLWVIISCKPEAANSITRSISVGVIRKLTSNQKRIEEFDLYISDMIKM